MPALASDGSCVHQPSAHADGLFRTNNFDLVRLIAAAQVAITHGLSHLDVNASHNPALAWISYLPGVPVFFFVSGFLISKSYETTVTLADYSINRVLRIYPALIVCTAFSLAAVYASGYFAQQAVAAGSVIGWFLAQTTILQFYNPDFLRGFGVGVMNGSLWTIAVELQFYVLVPVIYRFAGRLVPTRSGFDKVLILLFLAFLGANLAYFSIEEAHWDTLGRKLIGVSFVPWFYMFLLGVIAQRKFDIAHRLVAARAHIFVAAYAATCILLVDRGVLRAGNGISPALFLMLAASVLSCAYSAPRLSSTVLGRNDISYGVYIYHMPVINLFIFAGMTGDPAKLCIALGTVGLLAFLSWRLIEKPALRMKSHPFFPMYAASSPREMRQ